jgi:hypothetical protein
MRTVTVTMLALVGGFLAFLPVVSAVAAAVVAVAVNLRLRRRAARHH